MSKLHRPFHASVAALLWLASGLFFTQAHAQPIAWVDVHFHFIAESSGGAEQLANQGLELMNQERIRRLVVLPPPQSKTGVLDGSQLVEVLKKHGDRFAVVAGGATLNPILHNYSKQTQIPEAALKEFREQALRIADFGVVGFGEIALHHLSLNSKHDYESVPADHPMLLVLADVAAERDLVMDLHFDPVLTLTPVPAELKEFNNPDIFQPNIEAFERLLQRNRKAKIVWAHAGGLDFIGQYTPTLVRDMLSRHSNLFLSIRPMARTPGVMVTPSGEVNPEWVQVVQEYSDRFVFGSDSFLVDPGAKSGSAARLFAERSKAQRMGIRRVLMALPRELARKVGFENAERLYRLK
ncbi:MAG: amidohydrolase family protein [Hylemonella sp.]